MRQDKPQKNRLGRSVERSITKIEFGYKNVLWAVQVGKNPKIFEFEIVAYSGVILPNYQIYHIGISRKAIPSSEYGQTWC